MAYGRPHPRDRRNSWSGSQPASPGVPVEIEMNPWRQQDLPVPKASLDRSSDAPSFGPAEPERSPAAGASSSAPAATQSAVFAPSSSSPSPSPSPPLLTLPAFLAQVTSLQVSIAALNTLTAQVTALHAQTGPFLPKKTGGTPNADMYEEDDDNLDPASAADLTGRDPTPPSAADEQEARSAHQAALIDLSYQANACISSIHTYLTILKIDTEETYTSMSTSSDSPQKNMKTSRDFETKMSTFRPLLTSFKSSLLAYNSEQSNYKFLLKQQIRKEYLSLCPDATENQVYKAVENDKDWGMGLVRRDPVAKFLDGVGLRDYSFGFGFGHSHGTVFSERGEGSDDNGIYTVNWGWEETTTEIKDVLDRVSGLRGEIRRVEAVIKGLRGLYRELEGLGRVVKRERDTPRRDPDLGVQARSGAFGNDAERERERKMDKREASMLCCGLLGGGVGRRWVANIATVLRRTSLGAMAVLDGVMIDVRRALVRRGY